MSNIVQFSNIFLQIGSLFYAVLILIIYSKKRTTLTLENLVYSSLLITVCINLIVNIEANLLPAIIENEKIIILLHKADLIAFCAWLSFSTYYIFITTSSKAQGYIPYTENKELKYFKKVALIIGLLFTVSLLLILILDLRFNDMNFSSSEGFVGEDTFIKIIWFINLSVFMMWFINIMFFVFIKINNHRLQSRKKEVKAVIRSYNPRVVISIALYLMSMGLVIMTDYGSFSNLHIQSVGPCIIVVQLLFLIFTVISNLSLLTNANRLSLENYSSLLILTPLISIASLIELFIPNTLTTVVVATFITVYMYYSIENPDIKMIEELNANRLEADQANLQKTRFLSNMSHEIRTPLNAIIGFSQALKQENISKEAREEVDDIIMSSNNLLDIVNGILDISKIESNTIEIEEKEYDSEQMFKEIVALAKARLGSRPIDFRINIDNTISPVLYGDYLRVKQVIINLLTNSIKYTKEGFIDFTITHHIQDGKDYLHVSVRDSGIGIKPEDLSKLFTKFQRLDLEKNASTEGTGLGLAITKSLIELMGGSVEVKSEYGKGSEFIIDLAQTIVNKTAQEIKKVDDTADIVEVDSSKRVIVVDDNKVNLKVASRLLKDYNIEPELVESGEEIIEKVKNGINYDLILMDDMMPKLSGTDTMRLLKEIPGFHTPIVALTANAISGMRDKYLQAGFDEYLAKPINREQLSSIINYFLGDTKEHTTLEFEGKTSVIKTVKVDETEDERNKNNSRLDGDINNQNVVSEQPVSQNNNESDVDKTAYNSNLSNDINNQNLVVEDKPTNKVEVSDIPALKEEIKEEKVEVPETKEASQDETIEMKIEEPVVEEQAVEEQAVEEQKEEVVEQSQQDDSSNIANKHSKEFLESKGVDVDHGIELLGDMETYDMIIEEFLKNTPDRLEKLKTLKEAADMPNYAIEAHALKSDCKYLGFMGLADIAYKHELAGKDNNSEEVNNTFDEFYNETNKVVEIVKEYLSE